MSAWGWVLLGIGMLGAGVWFVLAVGKAADRRDQFLPQRWVDDGKIRRGRSEKAS